MIKFGTDGWRAVISEDFTFENVRKVAQAIAEYFKNTPVNADARGRKEKLIIVGYDTRFLSSTYARLVSEVMAGNGIKVIFSDNNTPTPMLSYCIKNRRLDGGIMITASHNPYQFNGIKVKASYAGSATPDITQKIEVCLGKNKPDPILFEQAQKEGLIQQENIREDYIEFIKSYLDMEVFKQSSLSCIIDVMHGTGNLLFQDILKGTGLKLETIHNEINPSFEGVNPEPIPENLKLLREKLKKGYYDLGIAVDGDSDRVGAMTNHGEFITPGWIMSMLIMHFVKNKKMSGKVIKTISNSSLIEKVVKKFGLDFQETPVGFKHICKIMQQEDVLIGGEESGGIGFKDYIPERDGILSGILLLEMMAYNKKNISDMKKQMEEEFGTYEYSRLDIDYPEDKKKPLFEKLDKQPFKKLQHVEVEEVKTYDGRKFICKDHSWLLFRLSGTEPKLRIYSEASSIDRVKNLLEFGKEFARSI